MNIGAILKSANSSYDKVVKTTVLLRDMNDYAKVNEIYSQCKHSFVDFFLKYNYILKYN